MLKYFYLLGYKYVHLLPIYPKVKIFHVLNFHPIRLQTKFFNRVPNYYTLIFLALILFNPITQQANKSTMGTNKLMFYHPKTRHFAAN